MVAVQFVFAAKSAVKSRFCLSCEYFTIYFPLQDNEEPGVSAVHILGAQEARSARPKSDTSMCRQCNTDYAPRCTGRVQRVLTTIS